MSDSDTLQTPSPPDPREQHRRLCTCSTISDHPSQANLTALSGPEPTPCSEPEPAAQTRAESTGRCSFLGPVPVSDPPLAPQLPSLAVETRLHDDHHDSCFCQDLDQQFTKTCLLIAISSFVVFCSLPYHVLITLKAQQVKCGLIFNLI